MEIAKFNKFQCLCMHIKKNLFISRVRESLLLDFHLCAELRTMAAQASVCVSIIESEIERREWVIDLRAFETFALDGILYYCINFPCESWMCAGINTRFSLCHVERNVLSGERESERGNGLMCRGEDVAFACECARDTRTDRRRRRWQKLFFNSLTVLITFRLLTLTTCRAPQQRLRHIERTHKHLI
jgi:hypothetical protein